MPSLTSPHRYQLLLTTPNRRSGGLQPREGSRVLAMHRRRGEEGPVLRLPGMKSIGVKKMGMKSVGIIQLQRPQSLCDTSCRQSSKALAKSSLDGHQCSLLPPSPHLLSQWHTLSSPLHLLRSAGWPTSSSPSLASPSPGPLSSVLRSRPSLFQVSSFFSPLVLKML